MVLVHFLIYVIFPLFKILRLEISVWQRKSKPLLLIIKSGIVYSNPIFEINLDLFLSLKMLCLDAKDILARISSSGSDRMPTAARRIRLSAAGRKFVVAKILLPILEKRKNLKISSIFSNHNEEKS